MRKIYLDEELSVLVGQGSVDSGENVKLLLNGVLLLAVQHHLHELGTIGGDTSALSGDLGRVDDVLEDGLVDGGESAGSRADGDTLAAEVLVHDGAVGHHDNVLLLELLLELANQLGQERLALLVHHVRHKNNNGVLVGLATSALDLLSAGEAEVLQVGLQLVARGGLDVDDGLGDLLLELIGGHTLVLDDLAGSDNHFVLQLFSSKEVK